MREFITRTCSLAAGMTSSSAAALCVPRRAGFLHACRARGGCLEPSGLLPLPPLTPSIRISCWAEKRAAARCCGLIFSSALTSQISSWCASVPAHFPSPPLSVRALLLPLSISQAGSSCPAPAAARPASPSIPALLPVTLSAGGFPLPRV